MPQDIIFRDSPGEFEQHHSVSDYQHAASSSLNNIYNQVIKTLELSKLSMQQHYNRKLMLLIIKKDRVWLKTKHYKTGENRKLAPQRNGPRTVLQNYQTE